MDYQVQGKNEKRLNQTINQGKKKFKREFAAQPKISSTENETGFGSPFGGVINAGAGIKGAVTKGQTFKDNEKDKDGNVQLGKSRQYPIKKQTKIFC